ncbi:toxin-antitoxin system YwqK family antitoxin [Candidatus Woesearchaeota archaeon]|jgi:antitoxin component YwqK of YwqJK toxin-antitoxin module|nr:toxin-antitoxin system YwqK family antitoxin [bacterium]MBT7556071.1 toxin-antitoxin system YwqK family antitoxin [Candidatus Woesearchaeota archaeon]
MKYTLLFIFLFGMAHANLGTFDKEGRFIYPETNKPYTGNLDVINNDWGKDAVEFNKNYVDGILHGTEKSYYKSGKLKSVGKFNQGKVNGIVTGYYEDGSVQVIAYFDNGIKQGRVVHYYPNGNRQQEQLYTNDELDGMHTTWYENGKPMETMPYSRGLAHGIGRTYYETGGVFEEVKFKYGTPKFIRVFTEDGKLSEQKGFLDKKIIERIVG